MRSAVAIAILSAALAGCGKAKANEPDSLNPAHCIAALSFEANELDRLGNRAEQVKQLVVRVSFEAEKAKAKGKARDEVKAEMRDFSWANHFEPTVMHRLAAQCRTHQDADPAFAEFRSKFLAFMNGKLS